MEFLPYIAAFLLVKRLQKFLAFSPLRAKWMSQLTLASWVVVGICIPAVFYLHSGWPSILGGALLLGAIWFADNEADFQPFNSFIKAHLPLGAASILAGLTEVVAPKFYDKYDNFFEFAIIAGFVWIFARWATSKKQREELNLANQQNIVLDKLWLNVRPSLPSKKRIAANIKSAANHAATTHPVRKARFLRRTHGRYRTRNSKPIKLCKQLLGSEYRAVK